MVYQNHKSHSTEVRRGIWQESVFGSVFFSLFINSSPCFSAFFRQLLSLRCRSGHLFLTPLGFYCGGGHTRSSDLGTDIFLSIRINVKPLFSHSIPTKLTSNPTSSYSTTASVLNLTPTFLRVTFNRTLSFPKHVSLLKAKFFPRLKALRCISASSWGPSKESPSLLYKAFLRLLLTYASLGWFAFLSIINITKLERFHLAAIRPSPVASRPPLSHFSFLRLLYLL